MEMIEAATIVGRDADSGGDAVVIVRYDEKHVAIAVSQELNGDVEIVLIKEDAKRVLAALAKALG